MIDKVKLDWSGWSEKQKALVAHYVRHGVKSQAYKAVYDPEGLKNLKTLTTKTYQAFNNPKIKARIELFQVEALRRANFGLDTVMESAVQANADKIVADLEADELIKVDATWVLKRAARLADFNIADFIVTDDEGRAVYDFSEATRADWYCIQEYTVDEIQKGARGDKFLVEKVKLKTHDKLRALELVGKHIEVQAFQENINTDPDTMVARTMKDFYGDAAGSNPSKARPVDADKPEPE